jgi:predicted enzyme related to lactoylglutathione lyase
MNMKLNFVGVWAAAFEAAFRFYTETLGLESSRSSPGWAWFDTRGMMFELFGGGLIDPQRDWGRGQQVRPVLGVADLESATLDLRRRGVSLGDELTPGPWGRLRELTAPEGIRWALAEDSSLAPEPSLDNPHILGAEMKVHNLPAQRAFYSDVMGLQPELDAQVQLGPNHGRLRLNQQPGEPFLVLQPGATSAHSDPPPVRLSFETRNIHQSADWLRQRRVRFINDVTEYPWGTDLVVLDGDDSPVQIVQYPAGVQQHPSIPRPTLPA